MSILKHDCQVFDATYRPTRPETTFNRLVGRNPYTFNMAPWTGFKKHHQLTVRSGHHGHSSYSKVVFYLTVVQFQFKNILGLSIPHHLIIPRMGR